jgi:hypothetical protein
MSQNELSHFFRVLKSRLYLANLLPTPFGIEVECPRCHETFWYAGKGLIEFSGDFMQPRLSCCHCKHVFTISFSDPVIIRKIKEFIEQYLKLLRQLELQSATEYQDSVLRINQMRLICEETQNKIIQLERYL